MSTTSTSGLKYSDYLDAVTIVSTTIATGSAFGVIVQNQPLVTGIFAGIATISSLLGRWLQSKGD